LVSDLIYIKIVKKDGTVLAIADVPLSIKFTWTSSTLYSTMSYSIIDKLFPSAYVPPTATAATGC
jgi:hypothetical protein